MRCKEILFLYISHTTRSHVRDNNQFYVCDKIIIVAFRCPIFSHSFTLTGRKEKLLKWVNQNEFNDIIGFSMCIVIKIQSHTPQQRASIWIFFYFFFLKIDGKVSNIFLFLYFYRVRERESNDVTLMRHKGNVSMAWNVMSENLKAFYNVLREIRKEFSLWVFLCFIFAVLLEISLRLAWK